MALKIPNLEESQCVAFTACGMLPKIEKAAIRKLSKHKNKLLIARARIAGQPEMVRAWTDGESGRHFHVDVATKEYFGTAGFPPSTTTITGIRSVAAVISEQPIHVEAEAEFKINQDELPSLIRSNVVESPPVDGVSLKMTGGTITVRGAPFYRMTWWLRSDELASIKLEARIATVVSDDYLVQSLSFLKAAFDAFVLRKSANERRD